MKRTQSLSYMSQAEQQTKKTKANCRCHHAATQSKGSEQINFKQGGRHMRPAQTSYLLLIGYNK